MIYERLSEALRLGQPVALVTVIDGPNRGSKLLVEEDGSSLGSLGDPDLDRVVVRDAVGELAAGITSVRHYGEHGEARERAVAVFVESFAPPPRMVIFGAVDFTAALGPCRQDARLPRDRVRRARGVRDAQAVPDGRRGRRRLAGPPSRDDR